MNVMETLISDLAVEKSTEMVSRFRIRGQKERCSGLSESDAKKFK